MKNLRKRITALFVSLCMVIMLMPITAFAASANPPTLRTDFDAVREMEVGYSDMIYVSEIAFDYDSNDTLTISSFTNNSPSKIRLTDQSTYFTLETLEVTPEGSPATFSVVITDGDSEVTQNITITVTPAVTILGGYVTLTAPVAGEAPVAPVSTSETTSITSTTWSPSVSGTFAAGTVYTATVVLAANDTASLFTIPEQDLQNCFRSSYDAITSRTLNTPPNAYTVSVSVTFAATENAIIPNSSYPITITAPVGGATIGNASVGNNNYFTVASTQWAEHGEQTYLASGSSFGYETTYVATVTLTPKTGYDFSGDYSYYTESNFHTSAFNAAKEGDNLIISIDFPATGSSPFITPSPIFGEDYIPVPGETAITTVTGNGYSGTISWSPTLETGGTFGYGTVYAATVSLTAASQDLPFPDGIQTGGNNVGYFENSGRTVSNVTNTDTALTFTVTFPQTTSLIEINYLDALTGFDYPTPGETPESITNASTASFTTAYNDSGYTVTALSWAGDFTADGEFDYEETYTATFTLTANQGYVFDSTSEITSRYFFEEGTPSITGNTGDVLTVTVEFWIDSAGEIQLVPITGLTDPAPNGTPDTLSTITADYEDDGYSVTALTWTGAMTSSGKFNYGTAYTANITLTADGAIFPNTIIANSALTDFHANAVCVSNTGTVLTLQIQFETLPANPNPDPTPNPQPDPGDTDDGNSDNSDNSADNNKPPVTTPEPEPEPEPTPALPPEENPYVLPSMEVEQTETGTQYTAANGATSSVTVTEDEGVKIEAGVNESGSVNSQSTAAAVAEAAAIAQANNEPSVAIDLPVGTTGLSKSTVEKLIDAAGDTEVVVNVPTIVDGEAVGTVSIPLTETTGQILTGMNFDTERTAEAEEYISKKWDTEVLGSFETAQKGGWGTDATITIELEQLGFEAEDETELYALIYDTKTGKWYEVPAKIKDGNVVFETKRSGVVTIVNKSVKK
jgi:hypothetical protein